MSFRIRELPARRQRAITSIGVFSHRRMPAKDGLAGNVHFVSTDV